jgi:hypothetical protein
VIPGPRPVPKLDRRKSGDKKLRLTDATRRRLAVLGKELGRKVLAEVAT